MSASSMPDPQVRFSDGASYERMMGEWSRLAGEQFLAWFAPPSNADWLDVGCGSGAFTALAIERCAPGTILGIDPSPSQLEFARARGLGRARFEQGDSMLSQVTDDAVDVTVAALVLHFLPDPLASVREMARVTRSGGIVGAYVWDPDHGGFPYDALLREMSGVGIPVATPPSTHVCEPGELSRLWNVAGLTDVATCRIEVMRQYASFEAYWDAAVASPRTARSIREAPAEAVAELRARLAAVLPRGVDGAIMPRARANAVRGRVA